MQKLKWRRIIFFSMFFLGTILLMVAWLSHDHLNVPFARSNKQYPSKKISFYSDAYQLYPNVLNFSNLLINMKSYLHSDGKLEKANHNERKEKTLLATHRSTVERSTVLFHDLNHQLVWKEILVCLGFFDILLTILYLRLKKLASIDLLTAGLSQTKFKQVARTLIDNHPDNYYAMICLDVKNFKLINATFGSACGDRMLRYLHDVIKRNLREDEAMARDSADHFNMLMQYEGKRKMEERLSELIEKINCFNDDRPHKYYVSIVQGVYVIQDKRLDMISILDRANLTKKKHDAINIIASCSCSFYTDADLQQLLNEKDIENRMEDAITNHEFIIYLQPKYELNNNTIVGGEALVRWLHPIQGMIYPDTFIPMMERSGFIVTLDLYIFEEVCKTLRKWLDMGLEAITISVNMSRVHFNCPNFLNRYLMIAKKYQVHPKYIEFELTESLVFGNMKAFIKVVQYLHDAGFTCSIDDFGSGYSSLNLLKDVHVDVIKLDRVFFLSEQLHNQRALQVIESVIQLAKLLDMKTVCEGVETMEQVAFLKSVHCDLVQGYVFSKPIPIDAFERLVFTKDFKDS